MDACFGTCIQNHKFYAISSVLAALAPGVTTRLVRRRPVDGRR